LSIGSLPFWLPARRNAARGEEALQGRWQGSFQHDGIREPVSVELAEEKSGWDGRFSTRDNSMTLESVRVSGNNVHFELPAKACSRAPQRGHPGGFGQWPGERLVLSQAHRRRLDALSFRP